MSRVLISTVTISGILLLTVAGCAVTDFDRTANFRAYRSYAWGESKAEVENPVYDSELISKHIKATVDDEFAKRGIVMNENDPDFRVSYHTFTEDKQQVIRGPVHYYSFFPPFGFYPVYPWAWGWGMPYQWGWMSPSRTSTYTEGTLIIDITDAKTDELVWRGSVSGNVDNAAALQKQLQKGIKAILKKYPVSPDEPLRLNTEQPIS